MSIQCPICRSHQVIMLDHGKKIGGVIRELSAGLPVAWLVPLLVRQPGLKSAVS
ncbi:hypothetical protein [Methylobacter sp.]|uniref:hypothetical protein n=1 Tax=Methylobacter sp. TaxID=2051955 RepID=UPI0025E23C90|nr:hypothetical protein [Methylobacter sp.]